LILIIDNYDSFTFNLVEFVRRYRPVEVRRNDEVGLDIVSELRPAGVLISPGPGRPADSGISLPLVRAWHQQIPILGVCLGHQIIGEVCGASVVHAAEPVHGKTSPIRHQGKGLFRNLPNPLQVMRYHSLLLDPASLPPSLEVTATTDAEEIMGIRHKFYNLVGVQFHPESILTEAGEQMICNWLAFAPETGG